MSPERLRFLIDCYGAKRKLWPPEERAAADALLARSPWARDPLERSAWLDEMLERARDEPDSTTLARLSALLNQVSRTPPTQPWWERLMARPFWPAASLVVTMGLFGLSLGFHQLGLEAETRAHSVLALVSLL